MAGFTTTDDGAWEFSFDDTPEIPDLPVHDPLNPQGPVAPNYLEGPGKWKNYTDGVLYELEALLRKWFETKLDDPEWNKKGAGGIWARRHTCGMVYEALYGKKVDLKDKECQVRLRRLPKLLAYYSTKIQKEGSIKGKKLTKSIYHLSLKRYKTVPPYSLKLRIEWLGDQGKLPTWHNMMLPKDDLKKGHARNPNTDENMRMRRERAKEEFNRKYNSKRYSKA